MRFPVGARLCVALVVAGQMSCAMGSREPTVVLSRAARDSMSAAFDRSNEHWNELADLNTMERMRHHSSNSARVPGLPAGARAIEHRARRELGTGGGHEAAAAGGDREL